MHLTAHLTFVKVLRLLMMSDHFVDNEAQEFLAELGVEISFFRQLAKSRNLSLLAVRDLREEA